MIDMIKIMALLAMVAFGISYIVFRGIWEKSDDVMTTALLDLKIVSALSLVMAVIVDYKLLVGLVVQEAPVFSLDILLLESDISGLIMMASGFYLLSLACTLIMIPLIRKEKKRDRASA